jgi:uncharacterized caspase-like protein
MLSAALAGAALLVFPASAQTANPRIALVIGESAYPDAALPTAANDAGLVAQVLQAAGFDVVGARDLDQKSVRESLRDFLDKANSAGPDMQAFVYFSGRALQYAGDNYLAPIDARIERDSDTPLEAVKLSDFTHALAAAPGLARVVVIDGARPNPYAQSGAPLAGGLALVDPEPNTIIAFNASPGSIGVEDAGDYGVYAKTLAGLMRQGGVDVSEVLADARIEVNRQTQGAQIPWSAGKLSAPYFLFERSADAPPVKRQAVSKKPLKQLSAAEAYQTVIARDRLSDYEEFLRDHRRSEQAKRIEAILAARREALFWRRALDSNSPRGYWTYLNRYPHGPHAYDAGRRLDALAARRVPPPDFAVIEYEDLPPPPPDEFVYADRPVYYFGGDDYGPPPPPPPPAYVVEYDDDDWRNLPPPPPPTLAGVLPTLAIAIPLMLTARAFHGRPDRDGRAPRSAPPPDRRPIGPPALPHGVTVVATPAPSAPAPTRAPGANAPGQVKFAPPPKAEPGGRPPAPTRTNVAPPVPGVSPTPATSATAQPTNGRKPLPTPGASTEPGATPQPTNGRKPLPTPGASTEPGATPQPTNGRKPLPTPGASPEPGATPQPTNGRKPLPTPGASPEPSATPQPTNGRKPLPTPGASMEPGATPQPTNGRKPLPTPGATPEVTPLKTLPKPTKSDIAPGETKTPADHGTPAPKLKPDADLKPRKTPNPPPANDAAEPIKPRPNLKPAEEAPKPKALDAPRPTPLPRAEPPKPAPAPRVEAPKLAPAPRVEAPRPAPAPRVEAPRPAPAPRVEAPRPAPAPRVEAPRPAPAPHVEAPRPAVGACGHPGQPRC